MMENGSSEIIENNKMENRRREGKRKSYKSCYLADLKNNA